MPGKSEDRKQLATDRLLEILRGEESPGGGDEATVSIGVSEAEERALLKKTAARKEEKIPEAESLPATAQKKRGFEIPLNRESLLNFAVGVKRFVLGEKQGVVGLDIGSHSLKYVRVQYDGQNGRLVDFGTAVFPRSADDAPISESERAAFVEKVLGRETSKHYALNSAVFGPQTSIRHVTLPKVAKNELRDAIIWNVRKDLPFSIDNSLMDFTVVGEIEEKGAAKLSVVSAIAERPIVDAHLAFLEKAKLRPSRIQADPLAIFNSFATHLADEKIRNGAIIDIGAKTSYIIFVGNGQLQFARELAIGGDDITGEMVGTISTKSGMVRIEWDEAEALKRDYGIPRDGENGVTSTGIEFGQLRSIMLPVLERLMTQVQRSIDYYRSKFQFGDPERIFLSGGTAMMKNIVSFISEYLGKETKVIDPFQIFNLGEHLKADANVAGQSPAYMVACGLALGKQKGINLLPEELQAVEKAESVKRIAKIGAVLTIFSLGVMSFNVMSSVNTYGERLENLTRENPEAARILESYARLDQAKKNVAAQIAAFEQELSQFSPKADI